MRWSFLLSGTYSDLDSLGFSLFGLHDTEIENPVLEIGFNGICLDVAR